MRITVQVFVSSAMHELEYEREVAEEEIRRLSMEPDLFELFPSMNLSPVQAYLGAVRDCDVFVLILWKTMSGAVRDEYHEALVAGKPILIFIKSLKEGERREEKLDGFLRQLQGGSSDEDADNAGPAMTRRTVFRYYRRLSELRKELREGIMTAVVQHFQDPVFTISREEMYDLGRAVIRGAESRLCLFQQTPSLLLGARGYLEPPDHKLIHEAKFLEALETWIGRHQGDPGAEFLHLFSAHSTRRELKRLGLKGNAAYSQELHRRLDRWREIQGSSAGRFRFGVVAEPFSGPLIVGDDRYAIWILGNEDAIAVSRTDGKLSETLIRLLRARCSADVLSRAFEERLGLGEGSGGDGPKPR